MLPHADIVGYLNYLQIKCVAHCQELRHYRLPAIQSRATCRLRDAWIIRIIYITAGQAFSDNVNETTSAGTLYRSKELQKHEYYGKIRQKHTYRHVKYLYGNMLPEMRIFVDLWTRSSRAAVAKILARNASCPFFARHLYHLIGN